MITYTSGNLLADDAEALVNAVNCVGVMGKGIALTFKHRFPTNFAAYAVACESGEVQPGRMFVTESGAPLEPRWIVNFPTKQHWRDPSRLSWIDAGLVDLGRFIETNHVRSIALPALGCGNGGLAWAEVKVLIEQSLAALDKVEVRVYEPL